MRQVCELPLLRDPESLIGTLRIVPDTAFTVPVRDRLGSKHPCTERASELGQPTRSALLLQPQPSVPGSGTRLRIVAVA